MYNNTKLTKLRMVNYTIRDNSLKNHDNSLKDHDNSLKDGDNSLKDGENVPPR